MMTDMMKGNLTNMLPMIVIGGWINWAFSGFLTSETETHISHCVYQYVPHDDTIDSFMNLQGVAS